MKTKKLLILFFVTLALVSVLALSAAAERSFAESPNVITYSFLNEGFSSHPGYLGMYVKDGFICVRFDSSLAGQSFELHLGTVSRAVDCYLGLVDDGCSSHFGTLGYEADGMSLFYRSSLGDGNFSRHNIPEYFVQSTLSGDVDLCADVCLNDSAEFFISFIYASDGDVYDASGRSFSEYAFVDFANIPTSPPESNKDSGSFFPVVGEMVGILTGGLGTFAAGVGNGLSALVLNIFTNGAGADMTLSVFGALIVVFAGLALAIGLSKFICGWVSSLGSSG